MTAPVNLDVAQDASGSDSHPMPTARVNLLPVEIIVRRTVRTVQRRLLVALAFVVVGCLAANGYYRLDESRASSALESQQAAVTALRSAQATYAEVPRVRAESAAIDTGLAQLMANDVRWDGQLAALLADPGGEITLTGVTGTVVDVTVIAAAVTGEAPGVLDDSGAEHVGVLTVTGRASTHQVVADWVDALATVEGFLVPYIRSSAVAEEGLGGVDFTVEITLGAAVRTMRYAADVPPAGDATDPASAGSLSDGG